MTPVSIRLNGEEWGRLLDRVHQYRRDRSDPCDLGLSTVLEHLFQIRDYRYMNSSHDYWVTFQDAESAVWFRLRI